MELRFNLNSRIYLNYAIPQVMLPSRRFITKEVANRKCFRGGPPRDVISGSIAARTPNLEDLDNYAMKQWEV